MNFRYDILVNRNYLLPKEYIPFDLVNVPIPFQAELDEPKRKLRKKAAWAAKYLFEQAEHDNMKLRGISGYRSYERQEKIFSESIERSGLEHTTKYIAPPGGSEHQTGLALDVSSPLMDYELESEFGQTKEGIWLKRHAPYYGFILRYPEHKEHITGYAYEPWHIRYVTKPLALCLAKADITLEEYFCL